MLHFKKKRFGEFLNDVTFGYLQRREANIAPFNFEVVWEIGQRERRGKWSGHASRTKEGFR